ncbi:hypothetical protein [Thalassolituus sp.]|uniref:hypothetical protein n=1 Tax=Thalassolituus sp. TaxID=2030822 RepID=UPI003517E181
MAIECFFVVTINFDYDGEENTAFAAIDGFHDTRGRRSILHALGFLVGKHHLAFLDSITGSPEQAISDAAKVTQVAVVGPDYVGMKPTMAVQGYR